VKNLGKLGQRLERISLKVVSVNVAPIYKAIKEIIII